MPLTPAAFRSLPSLQDISPTGTFRSDIEAGWYGHRARPYLVDGAGVTKPQHWYGDQITEMEGQTGMLYRRNRYVDPRARSRRWTPSGSRGG